MKSMKEIREEVLTIGITQRLVELNEEIAALKSLLKEKPELEVRKPMTLKQRKAISKRMKAMWKAKRNA